MYQPLRFQTDVEALVRFVEETTPDRIISETVNKLRAGLAPTALLKAAALAIVRSTELPAGHHGGAVHPISGLHGCLHTARRLGGEAGYLPLIQHVAVCNHHIHSPHMGPYIMPELEPRDGSVDAAYEVFHDIESSVVHLGEVNTVQPDGEQLAATVAAFLSNIASRRPVAAEQCLLWLLERQSPGEVLDHLLPLCIARNHLDDHNFLYPVLTAIALEDIGWDCASVLLRPVVRYHARDASDISIDADFRFERLESALHEFNLLSTELPVSTGPAETDTIGELGNRIGRSRKFSDNIELMAKALADGLSLEGAGEALSIGASTVFVSTTYGNPMDSHLHTGVATRRFLTRLSGVSQRSRVLALLSGLTGPECTCSEPLMTWVPAVEPAVRAALPHRDQEQLLEAIRDCIEQQPKADWRSTLRVDEVVAPRAARDAMVLAQQYVEQNYDVPVLFEQLGALVSRDDFTELHSIKQHQAIVDEYNTTRAPLRNVHVLAAAKSAVCIRSGKEQSVFDQLSPLLH